MKYKHHFKKENIEGGKTGCKQDYIGEFDELLLMFNIDMPGLSTRGNSRITLKYILMSIMQWLTGGLWLTTGPFVIKLMKLEKCPDNIHN